MYVDDCVCVLSDLTSLPLLGVGRKSWYVIIIQTLKFIIISFINKTIIVSIILYIIIIIYHDFLPTPRRGSHVKSGKTHTQSSSYTP